MVERTSHNIIDIGECCDFVVTMPNLRKDSRGRSPFWICCYTSSTGQRLQKSTKVTIKPFKGEKRKDSSPKTAAEREGKLGKSALQSSVPKTTRRRYADRATGKKIIGQILERTTGEPLHNYKARDRLNHWLDMKIN